MWKILCFFKNTEDACYYLCSAKQVLFTQCSSSGLKGKHKCFSFQAVPPEYNWVKYKVTSYWEVNWGQSLCLSTVTHLGCFPAWSQPSGERWESLFPVAAASLHWGLLSCCEIPGERGLCLQCYQPAFWGTGALWSLWNKHQASVLAANFLLHG